MFKTYSIPYSVKNIYHCTKDPQRLSHLGIFITGVSIHVCTIMLLPIGLFLVFHTWVVQLVMKPKHNVNRSFNTVIC